MKKRHKAILIVGAGALVYSIGIMLGVSFLNGDNINKKDSNVAATKPSYMPSDSPESLSKWVAEIQPAAGGSGGNH